MSVLAIIGGALSTAATVIGSALSTAASFLMTKLPVVLENAAICVNAISLVLTKVGEILNIAPENEKPEELGAKIFQEGTRPKEVEESTQEYLDYLRNEVQFDKSKFEEMSKEEKLNCEVLGDTMIAKSIEEKTGVEISADFLLAIPKVNLQYHMFIELIKAFSSVRVASLNEFTRYLSNNMSENEAKVIGVAIKGAIKEVYPEMSQEDIRDEIIKMKMEYNAEE